MWYGPSRLLWNAMRLPSGLHAGRRFDAVVFVSCRIGDAASLTYAVTSARNAARYSARNTTSLFRVISTLGRAGRAKDLERLPGERDGEHRDERTTKQERCLRRQALLDRRLGDEGVRDEEVRDHHIYGRPEELEGRDQALHRSLPLATPAGVPAGSVGSACRGPGRDAVSSMRRSAPSLIQPLVIATMSGQRASVYRRWSRTLRVSRTIAATCSVDAQ